MRPLTLAFSLATLSLIAAPASAQEDTATGPEPEMREAAPTAQEGLIKRDAKGAVSGEDEDEDPESVTTDPDALSPLTAPVNPGPSRQSEAFERRLAGWTAIGLGIPAAAWGATKFGDAAAEKDDRAVRNRAAQDGGAAMLGGAAVAAQGAAILHEEDRREREAAAAERRAKLFPDTLAAPDPFLLTLERDAETARAQRDTAGTVILLGGILAGALIAAAPGEDSDRVALVAGGAALAAVASGAGVILWNTPSSEELLLEEARSRP